MKSFSLILTYSLRLLLRERRRYILPVLSLFLTAFVVSSTLLLTKSGELYLSQKQKELLGGDINLESSFPLDKEKINQLLGSSGGAVSYEEDFFATVSYLTTSQAVSLRVVDSAFPLYGEFLMKEGTYTTPRDSEIFIDESLSTKLNASVGSVIMFNNKPYTVIGVWAREPDALASVGFFSKVLISKEGFIRSGLDPTLIRAEYKANIVVPQLSSDIKNTIISYGKEIGIRVKIAGTGEQGIERGLKNVSAFLIVAVLLSCILSAVNIYASTVYLLALLRTSFATLLALGLTKNKLTFLIFLSLSYVVLFGTLFGVFTSYITFNLIQSRVEELYFVALPTPSFLYALFVTLLLTFATALASYIPSLRTILQLSPRALLLGLEEEKEQKVIRNIMLATVIALLPLVVIASVLLSSATFGILVVFGIVVTYIVLSTIFFFLLSFFYARRKNNSFLVRTILSQKKADGFFGVISFTSLFVALTALVTLTLVQSSLSSFITKDLGQTIPPTYVIDVQKSQKQELLNAFPDIVLFPNIGARILTIDNLNIQEGLAKGDETISRELGREYNLTYRKELLSSEKIVSGVTTLGTSGEVSVDQEFAERANIKLGSTIIFSIQGFPVSVTVTSIRESGSRSGMPFFFFVMSPEDIEQYPTTFFGYSYEKGDYQKRLGLFLSKNMPSVSLINTDEIGKLASQIVSVLLILIFIITVPPLILATLLVATLIVSSYKVRKRDSVRLLALGATKKWVNTLYLLETISTVLVASILSYLFGMILTYGITKEYLTITSLDFFDVKLVIILFGIILSIISVAIILSYVDRRKIREVLMYEENQ